MKKLFYTFLFCTYALSACSQNKEVPLFEKTSTIASSLVPFLTKKGNFIYVNRQTLQPAFTEAYEQASLFTSSGYAIVVNDKNESAVINTEGKKIIQFSEYDINIEQINGLTFYKKELEYSKKLPFWKWGWNILGSGFTKEETYHKIEIGVLESGQVIEKVTVPYSYDDYYLSFQPVGSDRVFWRNQLFTIKKNKLVRSVKKVVDVLEQERYVLQNKDVFTFHYLNNSKKVSHPLKGTHSVGFTFQETTLVLNNLNTERYEPALPKLLVDQKTQEILVFPQYDKVLPQQIKQATAEQFAFLQKTSWLYSIPSSPYFLLGAYNFDEDNSFIEWRYLSIDGILSDTIPLQSFQAVDQVGNLLWPDAQLILGEKLLKESRQWGAIKKIIYYDPFYLITFSNDKNCKNVGVWNAISQQWDVEPHYQSVLMLDKENQMYGLQKHDQQGYTIYNHVTKKNLGNQNYDYATSDGWVRVKQTDGTYTSYYIDWKTGTIYREQ